MDETNETVALTLGTPTNAILGTSSATLTITDDDNLPVVGFQSSSYGVTEGDVTTVAITVTLDAASGLVVTVPYQTTAGGTSAAKASR